MKNNLRIEWFVTGILIIFIIGPLQIVWGQTSWKLTTNKSFNRLTLKNSSNIITSIPVIFPADKIMNDVSVSDVSVKNNLLEDWSALQTVSSVIKAIFFVNPYVRYMAADRSLFLQT